MNLIQDSSDVVDLEDVVPNLDKIAKRDQAEIDIAVENFLHPGGGGVIIWVRRDELVPRMAVRSKGTCLEFEEAAAIIACLKITVDEATTHLGEVFGLKHDEMAEAAGIAVEAIRERYRIVKG